MRISKDALMVMKERRLNNNLYRMEDLVIIDSKKVSITAQEEQLTYKLWHYRMDHLSDRGLIELSRRGLISAVRKKEDDLCEPCTYGK